MVGYLVQILKLACVGAIWGLALGHWWSPFYGVWIGLIIFYMLLAFGVRGPSADPPVQ